MGAGGARLLTAKTHALSHLETEPVSAALASPKILVVDDSLANRVALRRLLAKVDATLIEAASGQEALAASLENVAARLRRLKAGQPTLVSTDDLRDLEDEEDVGVEASEEAAENGEQQAGERAPAPSLTTPPRVPAHKIFTKL